MSTRRVRCPKPGAVKLGAVAPDNRRWNWVGSVLFGAYIARCRVVRAGLVRRIALAILRVFALGSSGRPRGLLFGLLAFTLNALEPVVGFSGQRDFPSLSE